MSILRRCTTIAATISSIATLVTVFWFDGPLLFVVWPGIIVIAGIYDRVGFHWDPRSRLLLLLPGFIVNVVLYTAGLVGISTLWRVTVGSPERPHEVAKKRG